MLARPDVLPAERPPPLAAGIMVAVALVAVCTGIVYPLKQITSVSSLGVVYLFGAVVVSAFWGVWHRATKCPGCAASEFARR